MFRVEGLARGVPLAKLFEFYTDYSHEDVEIMRKHEMNMALERVSKREGNHVIVDTTAKLMDMTKNMRYDILLHPEGNWYEMDIVIQCAQRAGLDFTVISDHRISDCLTDPKFLGAQTPLVTIAGEEWGGPGHAGRPMQSCSGPERAGERGSPFPACPPAGTGLRCLSGTR